VNNTLAIHELVLDAKHYSILFQNYTGGEKGIQNLSNLVSTINQMQYPVFGIEQDLFTKSAILMRGINCGHVFVDGNKCTAYIVTRIFLLCNGYELAPNIDEAEAFVTAMAINCSKYPIKRVRGWILRNTRKF